MQIFKLKWQLFPYRLFDLFKIYRVYRQTMQVSGKSDHKCRLSRKQEMQILQLKMATFPVLIVHFFFKINNIMVEAIDKIDKL